MEHFPAFMKLRDEPVALAGGAPTLLGKLDLLRSANARVHVYSAALSEPLAARAGEFTWHRRPLSPADLARVALVIVSTGDESEDARIAALARGENVPVNVVDRPRLSTFKIGRAHV